MTDIRQLLPTNIREALLAASLPSATNPFLTQTGAELFTESATMGVIEGGDLTDGGGLTLNIAAGYGFFEQFPDNDIIQRVDWLSQSLALPANSDLYVYFNNSAVLTTNGSQPNTIFNILLGRVVTNGAGIELIDQVPSNAEHTSNRFGDLFRKGMGSIYATGSIVSENVTPFHLNATPGRYYYASNSFTPAGGLDITFKPTLGGIVQPAINLVAKSYDLAGVLTPIPGTDYAKHSLYVVGNGANEQYYLVYATATYTTLLSAQQAPIPLPPTFIKDGVTLIAGIIVQQGAANITQIVDERPIIGFRPSGIAGSADHTMLLNLTLGNAGHTQFMMLDGSTPMAANLNLGANSIVNGLWAGTAVSEIYGGTNQTTYTTGDILYASAPNVLSKLAIGTPGQQLTVSGGLPVWSSGGTGTVTTLSVVTANGFAGTVATPTTTPAITLTTTITGILKGNGTAILAATDSDITGSLLTGYVSTIGVVSPADSILTAIEKLAGNAAATSGTVNTVAKFTSASVLGDSQITDTGVLVTIGGPGKFFSWSGTTAGFTPTGNFNVDMTGGIYMSVIGSDPFLITNPSGFSARFVVAGLTVSRLFTLPNVNGTFITTGNLTAITTTGTITAGTWHGTAIGEIYGGTNQTSYATGDILYASGANTLSKLGIGTAGQVLTVVAGVPAWVTDTDTGGTVTSVSWTTSQGVSAVIATPTTTPNITITLGALTGVTSFNGLVITANTGVITTGTWNGTAIANAFLANSSITINGSSTSLGGSVTITTTGTANRISVTGGAGLTPTIDISATYVGQASITTLGTITTGVWNGTAIANANLANSAITINGSSTSLGGSVTITVTGTANRISVTGGGGLTPTVDISATYVGQASITTVGTLTSGASGAGFTLALGVSTITGVLGEAHGGTNQSTYAAGDILYASAANTLAKRAIGTAGQVLTVSGGAPVWSTPAGASFTDSVSISPGALIASNANSGYTVLSNELTIGTSGTGASTAYGTVTVPQNYTSGGSLIIWTRRSGGATTFTCTAYINGTVDATINGSSVSPGSTNTWTQTTLTFGSAITAGSRIEINFGLQAAVGSTLYIGASQFNFTH